MRRPGSGQSRRSTITATGNRVPWTLVLAGFVLLALIVFPFLSMLSALPSAEHGALLSRETLDAAWTTVVAAGVAIAADAALGIPLAYWMARSRSRLRHVAVVAVLLPLAVPPVVGGLELVLWLGPYGWLGRFLGEVGLNPLDTIRGTILAQMFIAAPFVIIAARAGFAAVEPAVTDAARSLGSGPWRTLVRVTLPAARRGIVAGLVLGWLRAVGEFGASIVVAYHPFTLSNLAYVQLSGRGLRTALPTGVLLAAFGVAAAGVLVALDADRPRRRSLLDAAPPAGVPALPVGPAAVEAPPDGPTLEVAVRGRVGEFALDVALDAPDPAVAILGSSGAGKSLTLRTVAGLLSPASGRVVVGGRVLLDSEGGVDVPAERRGLGYVSQEDSLFRHLDVEDNVAFALTRLPPGQRAARVEDLLRMFGLTALRRARPRTLSGGERQQVALARALAAGPSALLLDEPFSSLDAGLRRTLRERVRQIHDTTGIPFVLVTHDRDDALDLADYVIVMAAGRVVQQGRIEEVFAHPVNRSVAQLVGISNVVAVSEVVTDGAGTATARTAWGDIDTEAPAQEVGGIIWELAVPTDAITLRFPGPGSRSGSAPGSGAGSAPGSRSGSAPGFAAGSAPGSAAGSAPGSAAGSAPGGVVASVRPGPADWRLTVRPSGGGDPLAAAVPRTTDGRPVVGAACQVVFDGTLCHLMAAGEAAPSPAELAPIAT